VPESQRRLAAQRSGSGLGLGGSALGADGEPLTEEELAALAEGGGAALGAEGPLGSAGTSAAAGAAGVATSTGKYVVPPGVTDTEIAIGLLYTVNGAAANAALGAAGITQGDERANYRILINDINANGGIAGRKIVPVFHGLDATSTQSLDSLFQAACDDLTQDHKVFAAFSGSNETFRECVSSRGVLPIDNGGLTLAGADTFRKYADYIEISTINLDRMMTLMLEGVNAQGYFGGWSPQLGRPVAGRAKVGVVLWDLPAFRNAADKVLVPGLRNLGYAPANGDVIRIPYPTRNTDLGASTAAVSSAVLKLNSSGVSHVFLLDATGVLTLLFSQEAETQGYKPRYGSNTQNGWQALADAGSVPAGQLPGVVGIGWLPSIDVPATENTDNGPYSSEARRRCMKLMKDNGETYADVNAAAVALGACDSFWFFREVMKLAPPPISRANYLLGVHALGGNFQSTGVFATRFDPTHHDGAAAYRHWSYVPRCQCVSYVSGNLPAP
jgi:ABC-type branched-subunit amino acid transport system substrate-binding protein